MVGDSLTVFDTPTAIVTKSKGDRRIINRAEWRVICERAALMSPELVVFEHVGGVPKQSASASFTFGRAVDAMDSGLWYAGLGPYVHYVAPVMWQRYFRLVDSRLGATEKQNLARQRATEMFPAYAHLFARARDHGRADAALLALYGRRVLAASKLTLSPGV